ncbi:MAG: DUF2156 domain-containing protein [Clostridia bacterium]|nr:DUF2156 domain-containing protein [Clostridia bacterium]
MLEFKNIELKDYEIFKKFTAESDELSCENTFINLIAWQNIYQNMFAVSDGQLFIMSGDRANKIFRLPMGGELEAGLLTLEKSFGKNLSFWIPEGKDFELFRKCRPNYHCAEKADACDYIYLRDDLAELAGKKYHSKRNHISAFSRKHAWRYETISPSNIPQVKLCAEQWYKENAHKADRFMLCEKETVGVILDNLSFLDVKGGAILIDDRVVAFTLGSPISPSAFDIHIEKALSEFSEGYAVINREFAKNELGQYKYINREDDMGIEGLRRAKLSYKPQLLLKKYFCTPEERN